MSRQSYIGITGFTRPEEVEVAIESYPLDNPRQLMIGVLATWESLRGIPLKPKWSKQTPWPAVIKDLFTDDPRILNIVHYSTEVGHESSMLADMLKIHELAGSNLHGIQLNIAWPEIRLVDEYRTAKGFQPRIILQLNRLAIEEASGKVQGVVEMLYHYAGSVDDILFDPSSGRGTPFEVDEARNYLLAIDRQGWDLGLGVAGGLGPDTLGLVEPLLGDFPSLSIDAQGRLRNLENDLDLEAVRIYLAMAVQLFARSSPQT